MATTTNKDLFTNVRACAHIRGHEIPLHQPDKVIARHGRERVMGKAPIHHNWTKRKYTSGQIDSYIEAGHNLGYRIQDGVLVIDGDKRHGSDEGFAALCEEIGYDFAGHRVHKTGADGFHIFGTVPAGFKAVDTVDGFAGVEFKGLGRQVVLPGSVHPETKRHYVVEHEGEFLPFPKKLLRIIKRPVIEGLGGGGEFETYEAARALNALDPTDFKDHDSWLKVMMSFHHATGGEGRAEFLEWSTFDSDYAKDAELIGRRWDSLHKERDSARTYRTLNHILKAKNLHQFTLNPAAAEAFNDIEDPDAFEFPVDEETSELPEPDDFDTGEEGEATDPDFDFNVRDPEYGDAAMGELYRMNATYAAVLESGKFRIMYQVHDQVLKRDNWVRVQPFDFMHMFSHRRIERNTEGRDARTAPTVALGKAWLEWPHRKTYHGVIFDPYGEETNEQPTKYRSKEMLNLFGGLAIEPSRGGSWQWLNELIFEALASGNQESYDYILNWIAYMFQHPAKQGEVATVFRGTQGVGKGTLGNLLCHIVGRHSMAIGSTELLSGRFNAHMQDLIFMFADEAVRPGDKQSESRIKHLITEPVIAYERKGLDVVLSKNFLHVMMATNSDWAIMAHQDERRFAMFDVKPVWRGNRTKFGKLLAELRAKDESGYRRFLFDMLKREIPDTWHPRQFPETGSLVEQKIRSQNPVHRFLYDCIDNEAAPFALMAGDWNVDPVLVFVEDFKRAYEQSTAARSPGAMTRDTTRGLMTEIRKIFPGLNDNVRHRPPEDMPHINTSPSDERARAFRLPSLPECRKAYAAFFNAAESDVFTKRAESEDDFG